MNNELNSLFQRELDKLAEELRQYPDEDSLWKLDGEILNSGGTLALHLCGNLEHFIGALLGNSGYVRDRDKEFSARNVPLAEIMEEIAETKKVLNDTLPNLTDEQLAGPYPGRIPYDMNVQEFLLHLYGHFTWHLGQLNYHRRLVAV